MIKLIDYSKRFGSLQAVHPTNLEIVKGEIYALLGPNGGGKTTIFKSIVGLCRPTAGNIEVAGEDVWQRPELVKSGLSFLPQRVTIPENLTVEEVLKFFASMKGASSGRISEILELIEIKSELRQYVGELSGGMLQRLGLVITFLADVPLYILDEPTLNLDLTGTKRFRRFVKGLKDKGKTVLFSSHTLLDAESLADRVGVMVDGRLVLDQSVSDFRARVKNQSNMVLVLAGRNPSLVDIALRNGAITAEFENGYFRYRADQVNQIKVLEAIRQTGEEIINISTEKPSLDQLVEAHYE